MKEFDMEHNIKDLETSLQIAMDKYSDMIYRIAINQMKTKEDADDIFQEVFIKWMQHREEFQNERHEKAWLIRVTINQCKSVLTSSWKKKNVEFSEEMENTLSYTDEIEEESEIVTTMKKLPEKYRAVIHLFYYEDYSIAEISEILQEKESTIRTKLTRARRRLKTLLKGVEIDV